MTIMLFTTNETTARHAIMQYQSAAVGYAWPMVMRWHRSEYSGKVIVHLQD